MFVYRQRLLASTSGGVSPFSFLSAKLVAVEVKLQLAFDSTSQILLPSLGWYDGKYFM